MTTACEKEAMPHRKLKVQNEEWDVWDVRPDVRPHRLVTLDGWLCFQHGQERKRLHPIPEGWDRVSEGELTDLFERAMDVAPAKKGPGRSETTGEFRAISLVGDDGAETDNRGPAR
jgi:hypothetical protein